MGRLEGLSVIITGGGSGIGRAVVERFVEEGAAVTAVDRVADRVKSLEASHEGKIVGVEADVTRYEDNLRAVEAAVSAFGKIDVFIGNAGIWDFGARMTDMEPARLSEAFDEMFAVNVKGYLLGAKAAAPELAKTKGQIILTLSRAALTPVGGGILYVSSKHAALGLVRNLAVELRPDIRVNGIAPGGTDTDLRGITALGEGDRSFMTLGDPNRRRPAPSERAGSYVFLASNESSSMNGNVIDLDDSSR